MAETSGKKRKRLDEAFEQPNRKQKRVAENVSLPETIKVSSVIQPRLSPPVIATTPGLSIADSIPFQSYTKPERRSSKKRRDGTGVKDLLLHSSAHRTVEYIGREDRPKTVEPFLKHYIGVFDPETGRLQVVEARKLVIRGTVRSRRAPDEAMAEWKTKQTAVDLKNELGQAFGTKKAKKAIRDLTENAISQRRPGDKDGSAVKPLKAGELALMESLGEMTANMATREELQAAVDQAKPVPKGNYEAERIQDVYSPEEIIGAEVLNAIPVRDWQQDTKAGKNIQLASRYVARRINVIAAHEEGLRRLRILRYLYWLIKCWRGAGQGKERGTKRLPPKERLKRDLESAPDTVIDSLRRRFSDQGVMRKSHVDLLMTHCCVFASILDGFEVDMADLAEDLRLEQKQMAQYFSEIGARMKTVKAQDRTEHIAQLALPLQFPQTRQRRRQ